MITNSETTQLGKTFKPVLDKHPGLNGVRLLSHGLDAFVGRAVLADLAEQTIDVQYYMFHQDTVGRLLIKTLLTAADRGVRVRMLIDDMYGEDGDSVWSAIDAHPSIEVRLFNPFYRRCPKNLQFITRFTTVNHRMHSKTFTVDNQATIVGGRNIGDEYFDADPNLAFADMDALVIGPVVTDVSDEFDQYWNSIHAYPITTLVPNNKRGVLEKERSALDEFYQEKKTSVYIDALKNSGFAKSLRNKSVDFKFAEAKIIHDSSAKMDKGANWKDELLMSKLAPYIQSATKEFILVSPYFVPGKKGADALCKLSENGVQVRILTNSLVSNDVSAVHTGYMRHRKQLLRSGVELYELNEQIKKKEGKRFTWLPGLSKSSLHAKTMVIDGKTMFVGSFNFDQRSLNINTEIGVVFHQQEIAGNASKHYNEHIEQVAFKVELTKNEKGKESLSWTGLKEGKEVVFDSEPYASFWKRLSVNLMRVLPIDSML